MWGFYVVFIGMRKIEQRGEIGMRKIELPEKLISVISIIDLCLNISDN